jgi:diaminopimelate decarboxylase
VPPARISFTGPDKTQHDHLVCLTMGVNVHIDNPLELDRLLDLAARTGKSPVVTLRLQPTANSISRFGMSAGEIRDCAMRLKSRDIPLAGIAFHINGYGIEDRIVAATECLSLMKDLAGEGITCRSVDIGGGFPMRYIEPSSAANVDDLPRWGEPSRKGDYPYDAPLAAEVAMQSVLSGILVHGDNRRFLRTQQISIIMQPGRALLDQCGLSAFKVIGRKMPSQGLPLLILDGMSFSLSETWFGADFLPAPVMINKAGRFNCSGSQFALAGRSCLESDFIRRIAVDFDPTPDIGDLIVFPNTAGYQMDSNESEFHQRPLPTKVAAMRGQTGWQYHREEAFSVEEFRHDHYAYQ